MHTKNFACVSNRKALLDEEEAMKAFRSSSIYGKVSDARMRVKTRENASCREWSYTEVKWYIIGRFVAS